MTERLAEDWEAQGRFAVGRIGMFVHNLNDRGIARVVINVSEALQGLGTDVTIVCIEDHREGARETSVPTVELAGKSTAKLTSIRLFALAMSQESFDVVMGHGEGPSRDVILARMLGPADSTVVVVSHIHRQTHGLRYKPLHDLIAEALYPRADLVAGVSPEVVDDLVAMVPSIAHKVEVLPNPTANRDRGADEGSIPHEWLGDPDLDVLIAVGHLGRRKGHDVSLRALRRVHARRPKTRFIVLGAVDDPGYFKELQTYVRQNKLGDIVAFLHDVRDVRPYLESADIFIHAARSEAFGLVTLEAMQAGVPVVVSDSPGGAGWLLGGGAHGRLVPPGDSEALADTVLELLDSPEERSRLARLGRLRSADFSSTAVAQRYLAAAASAARRHQAEHRTEACPRQDSNLGHPV